MKATYINNLMSSFYLWLDHEVLAMGEAFINYSGKLYNAPDPNFPNKQVYGAPFRQWVYDSSIPNVNIPSGVFINGSYVARGTSGLNLDFNKGRAIISGSASSNVTASYSFKEYNIYYTDERVDDRLSNLLLAGEAIDLTYDDSANTLQIDVELATVSNPGAAFFDSDQMTVTSGFVTIFELYGGVY